MMALAKRFAEGLPGKVDSIREKTEQLESSTEPMGLLDALRYESHKLAGSGATFGFDGVSHIARAFERHVDDLLDAHRSPAASDLEKLRLLAAELEGESGRAAGAEAATGTAPTGALGPDAGDRVLILRGAGHITEELDRQLAIYGIPSMRVADVTALVEQTRGVDGNGSGHRTVVVVHAEDLARPEMGQVVGELRGDGGRQVYVTVISDVDDFDTRLAAVRSGGDAFFTSPVDSARVLERIDGFFAPADREPYHIMIVDDDQEKLSTHAMILQQAGMITSVVSNPRNVFRVLVESKPDLILMDLHMPDASGMEVVAMIRQQEAFVGTPVVYLAEEHDGAKQLEAISHGADDFLATPIDPMRLVVSVRVRAARIRNMRYFMERDSLTGLLNHSQLLDGLENELHRASRSGVAVAFVMMDIDHFKRVNDSYGHLTGDRVLKGLGRLLRDRLRRTDVIGRYGGEEFGIVLYNTDQNAALSVMEAIRGAVSGIVQKSGREQFSVTVSCGIAMYPAFPTAVSLTYGADQALYAAKEQGRNRTVVYASPAGIT